MNQIEEATSLRQNTTNQIRGIQGNRDLTTEGKASQIAKIREAANGKLSKLRQEYAQERIDQNDAAFRKAFGLSFSSTTSNSEKQFARLSYRDALFRTDGVKTSEEAKRILQRARITGDRELARAIGLRAYEMGWRGILDEYTTESPDIADAVKEINRTSGNESKFHGMSAMQFSGIPVTAEERQAKTLPSFN